MGRTTIIQQRDRMVPFEKAVHEHRAPTDESIRLLNEFRQETIEELLKGVKVASTVLKDVTAYVMGPHITSSMQHTWVVKFNINGVEYKIDGAVPISEYVNNAGIDRVMSGKCLIVKNMYEKISSTISKIISQEIIKSFENLEF